MNKATETIWNTIAFTLILIGIVGLSWGAFQENGWPERLLGVFWDASTRQPLLIVPIIGGALLTVSVFLRGGLTPGRGNFFSGVLIYVLMACGIYYIYLWCLA